MRCSRAVVALAVGVLALSGAAPAGAATPGSHPPVRSAGLAASDSTDVARPFGSLGLLPGSRTVASGSPTISCTTTVDNPHNSSHVPETVNVVARMTCTAPVPEIRLKVALYHNRGLVAESPVRTVYGTNFNQVNSQCPAHLAHTKAGRGATGRPLRVTPHPTLRGLSGAIPWISPADCV